jgi:protein-S-isoprenylcysteine O-methyltransferase Ste14
MRPPAPLDRLDLPPVWGALHWAAIWLWSETMNLAPAPEALRPVGYAIGAAGALWGVWALAQFRGRGTPVEPGRRPRALVTTGPYRLTRNPMYRGLVWLTLGFVLIRGDLSALPLAALYAWVLSVRFIKPEERALEAAFGEAFRVWAASVRARL